MANETLHGFPLDVIIEEEINALQRHDSRHVTETTAKRRIINEHAINWAGRCQTCRVPAPCPTVRFLALPYSQERGFREEWLVEDEST